MSQARDEILDQAEARQEQADELDELNMKICAWRPIWPRPQPSSANYPRMRAEPADNGSPPGHAEQQRATLRSGGQQGGAAGGSEK